MTLQERYTFFKNNAAYIVGQCAEGALKLARAERWAESVDLEYRFEDDDIDWLGLDEKEQKKVKECLWMQAKHPQSNETTSLGGIINPDKNYLRVIAAELAWQLHDLIFPAEVF